MRNHALAVQHLKRYALVNVGYAEVNGNVLFCGDDLRNGIAHAPVGREGNVKLLFGLSKNISRRALACNLCFFGNKVNKIVHVEHVSASKDALGSSLSVLVHHRTVGYAVKRDVSRFGKLVFGNETNREKKRIARNILACFCNGTATLVYLCNGNALKAFAAVNFHYGVTELERNVKIIETLLNVACKTARVGHQLAYCVHLCALKRHTACHNQANVARAENNDLFAGKISLEVDVFLCRTCAVNACGACACNVERTAGALAAAHCKNDCLCLELEYAALGIGSRYYAVGGDVKHHCVKKEGNALGVHFFFITPSVLGAGQLLAKAMQTKAVVNALLQNAAKLFVTFQNQKVANACIVCCQSRTHACRATANNYKINFSHISEPPLFFAR